MGSGNSRMGSGSHRQRRWPTIKRTISSIFVCGASSSRSTYQMEDYPAELLVNSAEPGHQKKSKFTRGNCGLPLRHGADLTIKNKSGVSSERCIAANENPAIEVGPSNIDPGGKGKFLTESRELVPSRQFTADYRGNETASTSYLDQPSPNCIPANEKVGMDAMDYINNVNGGPSQVDERIDNSNSLLSHSRGGSFLDEVSVENNLSGTVSFSDTYFDCPAVPESTLDFRSLGDDTLEDVIPPDVGFLVSEREQSRQEGNRLLVDVVGSSSNILSGNSAEISSREMRRNSRRLFWDAFSRRSSRRQADSRTLVFSPDDSDNLRSRDRWLLDFGGDLISDEVGGNFRSHSSGSEGINEHLWNSRSEIWERLRGTLDSADHRTVACPSGIHAEGPCLCPPNLPTDESGARAGISRIVMLAEALFEVLDQIHQQPLALSLSMVSLPAPESVVDSFPVKTHRKTEKKIHADDVSQCYICLSEYEEGDKVRVLPCHHEYHMSCVDKWLKEIHGVCPLCRGDVREGLIESSNSN